MTDQSKPKLNGAVPVAVKRDADCSTSLTPVRNAFLDYVDPDLGRTAEYGKFVKGEFLFGRDKVIIPVGSHVVANMPTLSTGYIRWDNSKPTKKTRPIICPPKLCRNDVGDTDIDFWPLDDGNKPKDPWEAMSTLEMAILATGAAFTFETWTLGGRVALNKLREAYGRLMHLQPDEHPVLELGVSGYDGRKGPIYNPTFKIVSWIPKDAAGLGALAPEPAPAPAPVAPKQLAAPALDLDEPPPYEAGDPGHGGDGIPPDDGECPF